MSFSPNSYSTTDWYLFFEFNLTQFYQIINQINGFNLYFYESETIPFGSIINDLYQKTQKVLLQTEEVLFNLAHQCQLTTNTTVSPFDSSDLPARFSLHKESIDLFPKIETDLAWRNDLVPRGSSNPLDFQSNNTTESFFNALDLCKLTDISFQEISDLAFLVHSQIKHRQLQLTEVLASHQKWAVLFQIDRCLRASTKGLIALEQVICEKLNIDSKYDFITEVEQSRKIRALYVNLYYDIINTVPEKSNLESNLLFFKKTYLRFYNLTRNPLYIYFRVSDRYQLQNFMNRLHHIENSCTTTIDSERLLKDISIFLQLLLNINYRSELLENDHYILSELKAFLMNSVDEEIIPLDLRSLLVRLYGYHFEIDKLLRKKNYSVKDWKVVLDL